MTIEGSDTERGVSSTAASEAKREEGAKPAARSWKARVWENFASLGIALLIVFMVRSSIFESFKIPSGSMIPTLAIGDYLFVNKLAYGVKVPFSDLFSDAPIYVFHRDPPKRGDVIVFKYPRDESVYFIKRVIGVPGDRIEVRERQLYVNDKPVARDPMPDPKIRQVLDSQVLNDPQYTVTNPDMYMEHLNGVDHFMMLDRNSAGPRNYGPVTVPPESLFAMGDNRDVSNDSRFWGFVPLKNVAGKAELIWFSIWISPSESVFYFHPSRIGTTIR